MDPLLVLAALAAVAFLAAVVMLGQPGAGGAAALLFAAGAILAAIVVVLVVRTRRQPRWEPFVGTVARAATRLAPEGQVSYRGELWQARSTAGTIEEGAEVVVVAREGLVLSVRRSQGPDRPHA